MAADDEPLNLRPRSIGELLDDAWRFALAEGPVLLALNSLFAVPAFVAVLLVMTRPTPESWAWGLVLPLFAAAAVAATGLGSGACQEVLARRHEGRPVSLGECLGGALRRAPEHLAARAVVLAGVAVAGLFLVMPGLAVAVSTATTHVLLAEGVAGLTGALGGAARDARRQPVKAAAVVLHRLPLLGVVAVNLHLLTRIVLEASGSLGGPEAVLLGRMLTLSNPVYLGSLLFLSWLLLTPYAESCAFLLHQDGLVRFEGRDLSRRLRAVFPGSGAGMTAVAVLLAVAAQAESAGGAGQQLDLVRGVRQEVRRLLVEVRGAEPYPGSSHYEPRLQGLAARLEREGAGRRVHWFRKELEGFGRRSREGAVEVLKSLEEQLGLLEEATADPGQDAAGAPRATREQVKALLPEPDRGEDPDKPPEAAPQETRRPARRDDPGADGARAAGGPAAVTPRAGGEGWTRVDWLVLAGLVACVLVAAAVLGWARRPARPGPEDAGAGGDDSVLAVGEKEDRSAAQLWRQAEQEAARGRHLEGSRLTYLAVLAHLHDAGLIRLEGGRTNREYVAQVRRSGSAEACAETFRGLTQVFDRVWYGQRSCSGEEYTGLRELARKVREDAGRPGKPRVPGRPGVVETGES